MSTATTGPGGVPLRPKAPTACMSCRSRKLKCSGERPTCSNCPLYGAICEYAQGRAKSGPAKGSRRTKKDEPSGIARKASGSKSANANNNNSNGNDSGSISPNQALAQKVNANPFDPSTAYAQHQHQSSHSRHPSQSDYAPQQQHPSINSDFTFSAPIAGGFGSASAVGANWQGFDASSMNVDPSAAGGAPPPGSTGPVTFEQGGVFDIWSALYNPVDFLDVQAALNRPPSSADLSPHGPQTQSPPLGTPFNTGLPQTWDASGIPYHQLASAFEHGFAAAGVGHLGGGVGLGELGSDFGGTGGGSTGFSPPPQFGFTPSPQPPHQDLLTTGLTPASSGTSDPDDPIHQLLVASQQQQQQQQQNRTHSRSPSQTQTQSRTQTQTRSQLLRGTSPTGTGVGAGANDFNYDTIGPETDGIRVSGAMDGLGFAVHGGGDDDDGSLSGQIHAQPQPQVHATERSYGGLGLSELARARRLEQYAPNGGADVLAMISDDAPSPPPQQQPAQSDADVSMAGTSNPSGAASAKSPGSSSTTSGSVASAGQARLGSDAKRLARIHQFVPLLPFGTAETLLKEGVADCASSSSAAGGYGHGAGAGAGAGGDARRFCAGALLALVKVTDTVGQNDAGRAGGVDTDPVYLRAQQLAMPAYLDAVGGGPSLGSRGQKQGLDANIQWTDPRALSAAGLTYLAVRQVFTRGWCREAATFLRLSAGVIEGLPAMSIVRMWFGRVILLWDLGLGLAASPYGPLRLQRAATSTLITSVVQVHQHLRNDAWNASRADMQAKSQPTSNDGSPHSDPPVQEPQAPTNPFAPRNDGLLASRIPSLDGDARVFDSLVSLCLDLCFPPPAGKQNVFTGEAGVFAQYEPLRIQRWLESLPTALSSGTLQMVTVPEGWVRPAQISYTPPYVSSAAGDSHAFVRPPVAGDAHPMERVDRQALARVVQLVYYILCTRYYKPIMDYAGALPSPTVPSGTTPGSAERLTLLHVPAVRMATIRAAMANIVDTADWFIHTRHYWLWAFAEQGLVFAQNSALGRITNPNDASSSGPGGAYGSAVEGPNGGVLPSLAASSPATSAPGSTPGHQSGMGATTPMGSESSTPAPGKRSREEAMSPSANSDDPNTEENLRDVLAAGAQIPPDAPRRGLLLMIQDVLSAALDAFTVAPYLGAGHLASTRVLLTVAAAALSGANNSTARPILFIQRRVAGGLKARRAGEGQAQGKQDTDEERPTVRMRTENGAVATRTGSGENANGMDMMLDLFQPSVSGIGR